MNRRIYKYLIRPALGILGVVLFIVVLLHTSWGLSLLGQSLLSRYNLFNNAQLSVALIEGSPFSRLSLHDVKLTSSNDSTLVSIKNIEVGYRLWPMFKGRFYLSDLVVTQPCVVMTQHENLSWDLVDVFSSDEEVEADTSSSTFVFTLNRFIVSEGTVIAKSYAAGRDSTYKISDLSFQSNQLLIQDAFSGDLDYLQGKIWIPHAIAPANIALSAAFNGASLTLDSLRLQSDASNLNARGNLLLSSADSLLYKNSLSIKATPLAFDDIRLFVPGLAKGYSANLDLELSSAQQGLELAASMRLSDGAEAEVQGLIKTGETGSREVTLTTRVTKFNPAAFIDAPGIAGSYNADIATSFTGNKAEELKGRGSIYIFDSSLRGRSLDSTYLEAHIDAGKIDLSLITGMESAGLSIAGNITPFADKPAYSFSGRLSQFDVDPFIENAFTTDLNATLSVEGRGRSLDEAASKISFSLEPSRINAFQISQGDVTAEVDRGRILHEASISGRGGRIISDGEITIDEATTIEHLNLIVDQLDVSAILNDTLNNSISGSTRISGKIDDAGTVSASLTAQIDAAEFSRFRLTQASLDGTWDEGKIVLSSAGQLQNGSYQIEGIVQPGKDALVYEITQGAFENLDIGSFLTDSDQESDLNGTIFLVGRGIDFASMSLSGQVALSPSRLNQQRISSATAWFALQHDSLNIDMTMALPEGSSTISGYVNALSTLPQYRINKGVFSGFDVGKLAGLDNFSSDLNGGFSLNGRGFSPEDIIVDAQLTLDSSHINNVNIQEGSASFRVDENAVSLISDVLFEDAKFELRAEASSLEDSSHFRVSGLLDAVDVARLLGSDSTTSSINLAFDGAGEGLNPRQMSLAGRAYGDSSSFERINLDRIQLEFDLHEGLLSVDTLAISTNVAHFSGKGPLALFDDNGDRSSSFALTTTLRDIAPIADFLPGHSLAVNGGVLNTRVFGGPGRLRLDTRGSANGFVYDTFHVGEVDVRITGEFNQDRSLSNADITGDVLAVSIPGFVFEEINLEASYDSTRVQFASNGRLDRERGAQVSGSLFFEPEGQRINLDLVNLSLDEDRWALDQPASIEIGDNYRVNNFVIRSGNQHVALDGLVDLAGDQNLQLDIENFNVGTVAELLGFDGLDGPVTSHLDLKGPASAPIIQGNLDMQMVTFGQEVGDLSIAIAYDSLELKLDASLSQGTVTAARLNGVLPIDLTLTTPEESTTGAGISQNVAMEGGVDFSIRADSMAIDWLLPFIDPAFLNRLEGALTADITIQGTAQDPTLEGTGRLVDGVIRSPILGVTYEDFASDISLRDNVIELTNAIVRSGDGFVSGNGSIELSDLTSAILNIDVTASDFLAIGTRDYRATASGNMDLTGTLTSPVLKGDVTVLSADLFLNDASSSELADLNVQLTEEDLLTLEREFGIRATAADTTTFDFLEALEMDVEILLERDVWIRSKKNPDMNIQFSGELDVSKDPFQEYIAFGTIELIPDRSYINQFGKRFDITLGNLTFNGPATDPQLDFEARYEVPSRRSEQNAVTIYLDAEGKLENLNLILRAEPTMELTDILSYIATGQPANEALQLGGIDSQSLASTGAGFALNQGVGLLTGAIESLIQESGLELDVIQIEPLANAKGATITAGKYVTPRIFTSVSQPIGASDSDGTSTREEGTVVTLELQLIDSLLLRLLGGESVLQINLLWHHSY